jgi:uncharacterized protein (DUF1015 family)
MDAMADVRPFRGLRYNPRKVSIEKVVTQPYDKISRDMQERYYALDPNNLVRVILGKTLEGDNPENNVYTRAAATLRAWRASDVIEPMRAASFVAYFQRFLVPGTKEQRLRKGFIGLGRLEDYSRKIVYPHERTLAGPKQDRLQLLRHTRTHFEQIFMLYEDPEQRIDAMLEAAAAKTPDLEVSDEYGVTHTLWMLEDPSMLAEITAGMRDRKLIIADGHHRYETALAYRDEQRTLGQRNAESPHEWLPMTFFNMRSPALTVLPTHRVVQRLQSFSAGRLFEQASQFFDIETGSWSAEAFAAALTDAGRNRLTIGVATEKGTRCALLRLKDIDLSKVMEGFTEKQRTLDVTVLHRLLIERCLGVTEEAVTHESNISYVREFDAALKAVANGAQIAFLLNPVRLDQMRDIVYEGSVMPQKSTDFYPKVLSGLVLYSLDEHHHPY